VTYGFGWVKIAAEVLVLEGKVCGDKDFVAGWRAEDGAVVTDSQRHGFAVTGREVPANLLDKLEFPDRLERFLHAVGRINRVRDVTNSW
jgi:hypothetical protein